jgi:hypothetical protein
MTQQDEFVINPNTKRPIKVGGIVWRKLVKENILEDKYSDPAELYKLEPDEDAEEKIQELNKNLPLNQQSVRGRGKYKGKIVKRSRTLKPTEIAKYTSKLASKIIKQKSDFNEEDMSEDEMSEMLSNMLIQKMTAGDRKTIMPEKPRESYEMKESSEEDAQSSNESDFNDSEEIESF